MYIYDTKVISKLQQNGAQFVVFSNGKTAMVKSSTFIPGVNGKYAVGERK